jgi:ABC-type glycerol-3-phosphate transport system permease component
LIAGSEFPLINVAIAGLQSQYDSHWNLVLTATLLAVLPGIAALFTAKKNLLRNPIAEIEI